jgi:hypothetical protein
MRRRHHVENFSLAGDGTLTVSGYASPFDVGDFVVLAIEEGVAYIIDGIEPIFDPKRGYLHRYKISPVQTRFPFA